MHEFVCLDIVLNLVFMKFNAKRLWATTIRMLSYSLSVCLCICWQCTHIFMYFIVHAKIQICTREKKKERRDSIEFTHKLVSSLIFNIILQPHNVAALTWCFTCLSKSKNQHHHPLSTMLVYMMACNWRASGGFSPFSLRKINKRNMFYLCYLEMHFVYFT